MPCRASSIHRLREQCLWITDDVLAEAWNRFARLSLANNTRSHGRRHGSNVPGPMEAHRRLSKRRMTGAASMVHGGAPAFDLGALFGLGGFRKNGRLDDWKYEPPGVREKPDTILQSLKSAEDRAWERFLDTSDPLRNEDALQDPVEQSRAAFNNLSIFTQPPAEILSEHLVEAIEFLLSPRDEFGAGNIPRLAEFLSSNKTSLNALQSFLALSLEKATLETLEFSQLPSILFFCLTHPDVEAALGNICDVLQAAKQSAREVCLETTRLILKASADNQRHISHQKSLLDTWLCCLRLFTKTVEGNKQSLYWDPIYGALSSTIRQPSLIADHLATLTYAELSDVLIKHWLRTLCGGRGRADEIRSNTYHIRLDPMVSRAEEGALLATSVAAVQSLCEKLQVGPRWERRQEKPLMCLLEACRQQAIPLSVLSHEIVSILLHRGPPESVYGMYVQISVDYNIAISTGLATRIVHYFLDKKDFSRAWNVFKRNRNVPLTECPELPRELARRGICNSAFIWTLLGRQAPEDSLRAGNRSVMKLSLTQAHIDLVHEIANIYAESPHITPRTAFRRVWECYIYLRDRKARISPLLARAVLHATVSRYLAEGRHVDLRVFTYVLRLVAQIEGQLVADALNRVIWRVLRSRVWSYPRRSRAGEDGENVEETAENPPHAKIRISRHTIRKRGWLHWDEAHHKTMRKAREANLGAILEESHHAPLTIPLEISYDKLMGEARREATNTAKSLRPARGLVTLASASCNQHAGEDTTSEGVPTGHRYFDLGFRPSTPTSSFRFCLSRAAHRGISASASEQTRYQPLKSPPVQDECEDIAS